MKRGLEILEKYAGEDARITSAGGEVWCDAPMPSCTMTNSDHVEMLSLGWFLDDDIWSCHT